MVIGINAGSVVALKSGLSFYIINIIEGLARIDKENTYIIFCKKSEQPSFGSLPANFTVAPIAPEKNLPRLLWEQTILPFVLCRKFKIETLFSPNYTCPVFCPGFQSVVAFHDSSFFSYGYLFKPQRRIFRHIIRIAMICAHRAIAVSECTKRDIGKETGKIDKIRVVYNAAHARFNNKVESAAEIDRVRTKYSLKNKYIIFAGLYEPRKNIPRLIQAYARIQHKVEEELVVAGGGGWWQQTIYEAAKLPEVKDRLRLLGYVQNTDLPVLYKEASLFAFPSLYEGFGIAPLESLCCGTPVLASDNSCLPEVVGEAGIYVDPFSVDDIADKLLKALTDPGLMQNMRSHCRAQADKFSWEKSARETLLCLINS